MKSYNALYYLLTVLLIMGAFASMAQNSYGIGILIGVCIAFALVFFIQLIGQLRNEDHKDRSLVIEFFTLFLLSSIFALRISQVHFPFVEWIFGLAGTLLALIYVRKMIRFFRLFKSKSRFLTAAILAFYLGIVLFSIALVTIPFSPQLAEFFGGAALILTIGFLAAGLLRRRLLVDGENVSVFTVIAGFKDRSVLLLSLFLIFSFYLGFTSSGILPKLYSDEYPQAYFELVNRAEAGKEKPVNGRYEYEEFRKMYDRFLERDVKKYTK